MIVRYHSQLLVSYDIEQWPCFASTMTNLLTVYSLILFTRDKFGDRNRVETTSTRSIDANSPSPTERVHRVQLSRDTTLGPVRKSPNLSQAGKMFAWNNLHSLRYLNYECQELCHVCL